MNAISVSSSFGNEKHLSKFRFSIEKIKTIFTQGVNKYFWFIVFNESK